jgi:hypothetical protein
MAPLLKGFLAEAANEATSHCLLIHGARGCLNQFGTEQLFRDSRLLSAHNGSLGLLVPSLSPLSLTPPPFPSPRVRGARSSLWGSWDECRSTAGLCSAPTLTSLSTRRTPLNLWTSRARCRRTAHS